MEKYKITYQGKEIEIERLPNGRFKIPPLGQFTKHGLGSTWLDDGRIPYEKKGDIVGHRSSGGFNSGGKAVSLYDKKPRPVYNSNYNQGRFPANLLVSDDVLNDGRIRETGDVKEYKRKNMACAFPFGIKSINEFQGDSGSFSRYFDLDKWFEKKLKELPKSVQKTFPFLIVPKASKGEKNKGCEDLPEYNQATGYGKMPKKRCRVCGCMTAYQNRPGYELTCGHSDFEWVEPRESGRHKGILRNFHPTCKPLKLMSYLITLGSREGDIVLDPFLGSGTTALACQLLRRECIGIEINLDYYEIAQRRLQLKQKTWYKE